MITAKEALVILRELFPVPEYQTELILFTNGDVEIEVFRPAALDCQNVWRTEAVGIDDAIAEARENAEEMKRMSHEFHG